MPPVADEIAQMANSWRRDKGRLDHVAHEQVANPLCILPVSFVALLRFGVLGVSKDNIAGFLQKWNTEIQSFSADSIIHPCRNKTQASLQEPKDF